MNDLEFLAIGFQLAGDEALFMERQQLTRPARVPAEINQRDIIALSIRRMEAERRTSAAARVVIDGRKLNGNDAARIAPIQLRHTLPVDRIEKASWGERVVQDGEIWVWAVT